MILDGLNEQQKDSILKSMDKDTLVIAGAGSGKTKTLTVRVGYLINEMNVPKEQIFVATFSNKAAKELKERLQPYCGDMSDMWIGTFHSLCCRIIKQFGYLLGIDGFSILTKYDKDKILKNLITTYVKDESLLRNSETNKISNDLLKRISGDISNYKNNYISSFKIYDKYKDYSPNDNEQKYKYYLSKIYKAYNGICWNNKTFDFDDLLVYGCMLSKMKEVREWFNENIKWFNVDESQDTNKVQYDMLINLYCNNNIFFVGDDTQSIYGFRSAKPEYILNFKKNFKNGIVLSLDRNYRSTQVIVNASNELINNNTVMYKKKCYSKNVYGELIDDVEVKNEYNEAKYVARCIKEYNAKGIPLNEIAILYRANIQSKPIEDTFVSENIPIKLVGSLSFYDRKVIKDVLSFIKFYCNRNDITNFTRAISLFPSVGSRTVDTIIEFANTNNCDLLESATYNAKGKAINSVYMFEDIINSLDGLSPNECIDTVWKKINILTHKNHDTKKYDEDCEYVKELSDSCKKYIDTNVNATLQDYLLNISLITSADKTSGSDKVNAMTLHASKGLEFKIVFIIGCNKGRIPHIKSKELHEIEEERRLFYVGMTRAKEKLILTHADNKNKSEFIKEIPEKYRNEIKE